MRRWLNNLSIPRKLSLIVFSLSLVVVLLLSFSYFGLSILSDVRGFVGAEGLWSKSQKDAVYHLARYVTFQDENDFQFYLRDLDVPLGDRKARLELERALVDFDVVEEGLLQGRNHPRDTKGMARLFRRYHFVSFIEKATRAWQEGDRLLSALMVVGDDVRRHAQAGTLTLERQRAFLQRIDAINSDLTPLEDRFSYILGEGARWIKRWLLAGMIVLTLASLALGLLLAFRISRHLIGEIHALRDASTRIAKGDFSRPVEVSSKDEIGELAARFGEMMEQRKQAEGQLFLRATELNHANSRLVEAERLKNEFFATASHELRTPLTLVLSPVEALLAGNAGAVPPEQAALLKTIHNNATRLLQLVTGLLDVSRLEAGRMDVHNEPLDLVAATLGVLGDFDPLMKQKGLSSTFQKNRDRMPVMGDRYLYERILFNLLSNAVKFTPRGGRIAVDLHLEDNVARLMVGDNGIGISPADQKNLFQKFRQVDGASTRRFEGTGLGLALVREFAALLGGSVSLESQPGNGSVFTVAFDAPAAKTGAAPAEGPRHSTVVQRYGTAPEIQPERVEGADPVARILVVEDNEEMAAYISGILSASHDVRVARDGDSGVNLANAWRPDLVLSDIMMPGKDGLAVCRELKASAKTANIPVVLLTALTHREALMKGWEAGADDYLFKPFQARELTTRIRSILGYTLERRRLEERTRQLNQELEARVEERTKELTVLNAELEQFAFVAAHDLREPIRRVRLFGDLLKKGKDHLSAEEASYISRMQEGAERLNDLIGGLQAYTMAKGPSEPLQSVDLNEALRTALADLEIRIRESGGKVESDVLPHVPGHPAQLSQVFQNLISNALKFRTKERPIKVSIRSRPLDGGKVEVLVEDNGIGIDSQYIAQIFQPFKRLHNRREFEGVGMGLTICQKILQRHGGTIDVRSEVGKGSVFVLTLPTEA